MKKVVIGLLVLLCVAAAALAAVAARFEAKIRPNTTLGPLAIGGLDRQEALAKLREWWQSSSSKKISVVVPGEKIPPAAISISELGIAPDEKPTIDQLKVADFWDSARNVVGAGGEPNHFDIQFHRVANPPIALSTYLAKNVTKRSPARVIFSEGTIVRKPEQSGLQVDEKEFAQAVVKSIQADSPTLELPIKPAKQKISNEELEKITDVESTFTTHFPAARKNRNTNIRIASEKINGTVLLPGEKFSFNTTVGKRTIMDGFKEAPVFKNGKHDMGIGGGICQVSSTLYNASLSANLKVLERHNHSMPVPYLPVGRDATVDYGALDLVFVNNQTTPIAISSQYEPGAVTFRILGKKDPDLKIEITSANAKMWNVGTQTVEDRTLAPGRHKVVEKGSRGHSLLTYRVVSKNGKVIAREPLGRSFYKGSERIIAVGPSKAGPNPPAPGPFPTQTVPAIPPTSTSPLKPSGGVPNGI